MRENVDYWEERGNAVNWCLKYVKTKKTCKQDEGWGPNGVWQCDLAHFPNMLQPCLFLPHLGRCRVLFLSVFFLTHSLFWPMLMEWIWNSQVLLFWLHSFLYLLLSILLSFCLDYKHFSLLQISIVLKETGNWTCLSSKHWYNASYSNFNPLLPLCDVLFVLLLLNTAQT